MKTKDKRHYERPRMTAVELQHRTMLLQASPNNSVTPKSSIKGWEDGGTTTEEIFF